jgi:hypothetical protein
MTLWNLKRIGWYFYLLLQCLLRGWNTSSVNFRRFDKAKRKPTGGAEALSRMSEFRPVKTTLWLFSFLYGVASTGSTAPIYCIAVSVDCPSANVGPAPTTPLSRLHPQFRGRRSSRRVPPSCLCLYQSLVWADAHSSISSIGPPLFPGRGRVINNPRQAF